MTTNQNVHFHPCELNRNAIIMIALRAEDMTFIRATAVGAENCFHLYMISTRLAPLPFQPIKLRPAQTPVANSETALLG
jgi:hypothetical protein